MDYAHYNAVNFQWSVAQGVATLTLNRPARKNALTFGVYRELREVFQGLRQAPDVRAVVLAGAGGNFCSGGDVHDIIGPMMDYGMAEMVAFTQMTGDVVKAMRACPQPIVAAVDGVCTGAGAILAMAADMRLGTARSQVAFLFVRVGLAGCDMGACAILPRIVGQGRASELLYTGRAMGGEEAERWGFFNRLCGPEALAGEAGALAAQLAQGPTFAHATTKRALHQEWAMGVDEAIDAEAQAQAICLKSNDFRRAYEAFVARKQPVFEGN